MTSLREKYEAATREIQAPFAMVDLAAFRANAAGLTRRAHGRPVRVASKSVRSRELLRTVLAMPGYAGIMAFTLPEALWLATGDREPLSDDILVAYPTADRPALAELVRDPDAARTITLMVDSPAHLELISAAVAEAERGPDAPPVRVCLDIDTSWQPLGPGTRIGSYRSPVRTPAQAASLARAVVHRPELELDGIMAYEGQIAGVGDAPPGRPLYGRLLRGIQRRSALELARRRAAITRAVREVADLRFVNGGGTGSLHTTGRERAVTELAAGSGLYQPHLFDHYSSFRGRPAALFALPVVRRPAPDVATVLGGGYPASGPVDAHRPPIPHLPEGLAYSANEGAGEVQTPLIGEAARGLSVGDRVWMRHAKAGELCERFDTLHLVDSDTGTYEGAVPTYRGEGRTFL
ncbi:alanine racemase [Nocardiopsis terrae]|uniref:D-serine deaminase-like pyridoxal phosphate-dependent protein n=1 Tax=Nocardiopsis terrae TaxID=372655 RepID=A0ABR9HKW5_9ACTN|nr:amino acid deaminase/aldolase [Nocardiopsis terrae]MBE1459672.1 D-serine deaminase-like pyridoxal phosphate-dependent protein [Nocardiopsis terrae]GHC94584.1 alanine racemase [Nocardiopsis terrae]